MTIKDIVFSFIYLMLVYAIGFFIRKKHINDITYKYFFKALHLKMFGCFFVCWVFLFYYGFGDTLSYYEGITNIEHTAKVKNLNIINTFLAEPDTILDANPDTGQTYRIANNPDWLFFVKFMYFLQLFNLGEYVSLSIIVSFVCFLCNWLLFLKIIKLMPLKPDWIFYTVFFIPSIVLWSSGLLRDSVSYALLCLLLSVILKFKGYKLIKLLWIFVLAFFIFKFKPQIIIAIGAPLILAVVISSFNHIKNFFLRYSLIVLSVAVSLFAIAINFDYLQNLLLNDLILSNIEKLATTQGARIGETMNSEAASAYDIGTLDGSIANFLSMIPSGIVVTFFRPFLWEAKSAIMLLSCIESSLFIGFTLYIFFKVGAGYFFSSIFKNKYIFISFFYSIILGFMLGLASGNFGSLVRYKAACLSFYVFSLLYMYYLKKVDSKIATKIINT